MRLYIMRHGETDWNKKGLMQGSIDIPLNEFGIHLAQETASGLKREGIYFDKIYASPFVRAYKTAKIIAENYDIPIIKDVRIREMSFGKYEGSDIYKHRFEEEYKGINRCFDDPENYVCEEGAESYEEVFTRLNSFLEEEIFPLEGTCEHVLIVCHGAVIRGLLSIIKSLRLKDFWTMHQPNCSINIIKLENKKMSIEKEGQIYYDPKELPERRFL